MLHSSYGGVLELNDEPKYELDKCLECGTEILSDVYCDDCLDKFTEEEPELWSSYLEWLRSLNDV